MTEDLYGLLELRRPDAAPAVRQPRAGSKKFFCLILANVFSLLNLAVLGILIANHAEIIALFTTPALLGLAVIFLIVALIRGERPRWPYLSVLVPNLTTIALIIGLAGTSTMSRHESQIVSFIAPFTILVTIIVALLGIYWRRLTRRGEGPAAVGGTGSLPAAEGAAQITPAAGDTPLSRQIAAARRAGKSEEEIAETLQKEGLDFSTVSKALLERPAAGAALTEAAPQPAPGPAAPGTPARTQQQALKIAGALVLLAVLVPLLHRGYKEFVPLKGRLAGPDYGVSDGMPAPPAQVYGPLSESLLLHYSFDQDEKDRVTDKSGAGRHAKVHGANWRQEGPVGGSMFFSGQAYLESDDAGFPAGDAPRTVSYWFKLPRGRNAKLGSPHMLSYGRDEYNKFNSLGIDWRENRDSVVFSQHGACFVGADKVEFGKWYHAAYSYGGGGNHRFYLDGRESSGHNELRSLDTALSGKFRVGGQQVPEHSLDFMIDEIKIYGRAITGDEARELYGKPIK
ncbi:MAG TPA: hypothetical protein PKI19_11465 [Elusimicrobiales bacterium]|nr:hypothetical protein [Elusimicrobiales bacterium]